MYKKLFRITFAMLMLFAVSCSDEYLDTENKNNLTEENFYQTGFDYELAVNSCYTSLMSRGLFGLNFEFLYGSFGPDRIHEGANWDRISVFATTRQVNEVWRDLYFGFYRTTRVIERFINAGEIEGLSEEKRNRLHAEARALRAAYSFYLVTIYNEPPYYDYDNIPKDLNRTLGNGEAEQFWEAIEEDLLFCIDNEYLPRKGEYSSTDVGRITLGAARAMLGKAMLYKHYYYYSNPLHPGAKGSEEDIEDLRLAKSVFEDMIQEGSYSLVQPQGQTREDYLYALLSNTSFVDLPSDNYLYKSENNQESVWEVQFGDTRVHPAWLPGETRSGSFNAQWFGPYEKGYKNHEIHPNVWFRFEKDGAPAPFDRDPRAYATVYLDGDELDFRPESDFYNETFTSNEHYQVLALKRRLFNPRDLNGVITFGFGVRKHYYPVYNGAYPPSTDPGVADPTNRRMIRYADVLLMYAEVTELLGEDESQGLDALNKVRERVDMPIRTELTKENIIHERRVELAAEAPLPWFDMIRWSFDSDWGVDPQEWLSNQASPDGTGDFFEKGKHEYLPMPIREINLSNGKLEQNPGW